MKTHLVSSIALASFLIISLLVKAPIYRILSIVAVLVFHQAALVLFGVEYDKEMLLSWKRELDNLTRKVNILEAKPMPKERFVKRQQSLLEVIRNRQELQSFKR